MSKNTSPNEPLTNKEKFKPQNVKDSDKAGQQTRKAKAPDTPQGSEHHLQMKSMNRR